MASAYCSQIWGWSDRLAGSQVSCRYLGQPADEEEDPPLAGVQVLFQPRDVLVQGGAAPGIRRELPLPLVTLCTHLRQRLVWDNAAHQAMQAMKVCCILCVQRAVRA